MRASGVPSGAVHAEAVGEDGEREALLFAKDASEVKGLPAAIPHQRELIGQGRQRVVVVEVCKVGRCRGAGWG